jgi:hypothetical protein
MMLDAARRIAGAVCVREQVRVVAGVGERLDHRAYDRLRPLGRREGQAREVEGPHAPERTTSGSRVGPHLAASASTRRFVSPEVRSL